jgi:hypothetical protein
MVTDNWEDKCCRCEGDSQINLYPGKRACHLTCGPCSYPDSWERCQSCELVGHCQYAVNFLKKLKVKKGCYFIQQLTGEESLYHILNFVNNQYIKNEEAYLKNLKKINQKSSCFHK